MPTFSTTPRFILDNKKLTRQRQRIFEKIVLEQFVPDMESGSFRPSLRVKGVEGAPGVFEMTWDGDGRATWEYGEEIRSRTPHIIWRRLGSHDIFRQP